MSSQRALRALFAGTGALAVIACGVSSNPAGAPARAPGGSDEQKKEREENTEQQQGYPPGAYGAPSGTSQPGGVEGGYAQPPPGTGGEAEPALGTLSLAQAALDSNERDVTSALSSGNDCRTGCKALGSMLRARDRICDLNGPGDPGERCKTAKKRCDDAEERMKRGCGSC